MNLKKQNILFIARTMGLGGTENVIMQLCEILQPHVNKIIVCSCGGVNVDKLSNMGIKHYYVPDIADKRIYNIVLAIKTIKMIIKNENITIIHSHHRMAALYARVVGKNILKIMNVHNTFCDKRLLTRFSYSDTRLIAVGEQVKKNLISYYKIDNSKITVIHNATKTFKGDVYPLEELSKSKKNNHILIGNVGRLSKQKGMEYFIKAASKVIEKYPNARFYIIGDGEDYSKLRKLADNILPENTMNFMGYREDIQNIMAQLDFIVLSSLWEGLPLTPIEAFSVGKTVVATKVDGTIEIVEDEKNGLLVEPKNEYMLYKAMIRLCENRELLRKLESRAKSTYMEKFSFETLANKYLEFYNKL